MDVNIDPEKRRFWKHLKLPANDHIFLSGIFGIGKTFFVDKFFDDFQSQYELFKLSPVHYSISQTDDIIDYIKYDIVFQLFGKDIDFEKEDFSKWLTGQFYLEENFVDTVALIARHGNKIGRNISEIILELNALSRNVAEHQSKYKIDEEQEMFSFLKELSERENSIYEENRITQLISGMVDQLKIEIELIDDQEPEDLKEKDQLEIEKKEVVLVIDDLDRLDPDHIFRILNVFACHFDLSNVESQNKFGFDKIILVGDINNLRNIFSARYGSNTDFSGYVDKFYSREVFYLNNKRFITNAISSVLKTISIRMNTSESLNLQDSMSYESRLFKKILELLVQNDLINLRTLIKLSENRYSLFSTPFFLNGVKYRFKTDAFRIILIFDLLVQLFGTISSVDRALKELARRNPILIDTNILEELSLLLVFLDLKKTNAVEGNYTYRNHELDIEIEYDIPSTYVSVVGRVISVKSISTSNDRFDFPYAPLIYKAFQEYMKINKYYN